MTMKDLPLAAAIVVASVVAVALVNHFGNNILIKKPVA